MLHAEAQTNTHANKRVYGEWLMASEQARGDGRSTPGGNDERKWCAWWVLNGWPVGQTLSDCLLKGWKTESEMTAERTRKGAGGKNDDRCQNTITLWQPRFSPSSVSWPLPFSVIVRHLCHAARANQWVITNLKGSEIEKRASSMFYSALIT